MWVFVGICGYLWFVDLALTGSCRHSLETKEAAERCEAAMPQEEANEVAARARGDAAPRRTFPVARRKKQLRAQQELMRREVQAR